MCRDELVAEINRFLENADDATVTEVYWLLMTEFEG